MLLSRNHSLIILCAMKLISKLKDSVKMQKILKYVLLGLLAFYIFSVPSFGESSSAKRYIVYISMMLLGFMTVLYCFLYNKLVLNKTLILVPSFAAFAFAGTLIYSHQFRNWFTLILLTASFFIFYFSFNAIRNKHLLISVISLAFFLFSLYFIVHYRKEIIDFKSYANGYFRLGSYFDNQNAIGVYSTIGIASSFYLVLFWNKRIRFFFIAPIITSLLVGFTTGSRSFWLMVVLVVLVFLYFKFKKKRIVFLIVVISSIALFIAILFLPFMDTLRSRLVQAIQTFFGTGDKVDTSILER